MKDMPQDFDIFYHGERAWEYLQQRDEARAERDEARQYIATLEADKRQACRLLRAALKENPSWYSANAVEAQMFLDVHEEEAC